MDVSVRRSGQSTLTTAVLLAACGVVFFCAGIGVGFAVWGPQGAPEESGTPTETGAVTPPPSKTTPTEPADPGLEHLESVEDVWPARHLFIAVDGIVPSPESQDLLASIRPGGVILTPRNVQQNTQVADFVRSVKSAVGLGNNVYDLPLIATDQEGGVVNPLNLATAPGPREIASRGDLELARQTGKTYAEACMKVGVGVMLAPVLDIYVPGAPPRMESRTFGSDEKTVTAMGLWFASGVIDGGVIPVAKHYPGMGGVRVNARQTLPVLNQDTKELAGTMYPFADAAAKNIPGLLAGHVSVPALDKSDPPRPASLSPTMINTVLRERWEYGGVIIADDITNEAVTELHSLPDAAVEALASGCDAVIVTETDPAIIKAICDRIEQAVQNGELARSALRDSKARLDGCQAWLRSPKALDGTLPNVVPKPSDVTPPTDAANETDTTPEPAPVMAESEIIYTVQPGDALSKIAAKYDGVTTADIIEWNNLTNANIRVGQDLRIRVLEEAPAEEPEPEVIDVAQPEPELEPEPPVEPEVTELETEPETSTSVTEYVVESGDVISRIAAKFGVTTQQIMEWNDLSSANIRIGQKLMIGATAETEVEAPSEEVEPDPVEPEPEPEPETPSPETEEETGETETASGELTEYTVVGGDFLSKIATKFDVTTQQIMEWNNLSSTRLDIGQKLMIGGSAAQEVAPVPEPEESAPESEEAEPEPEVPDEPEVIEVVSAEDVSLDNAVEYTVQGGDALSKIASKFGVTTREIMEWNDLSSSNIRVGQTLKIVPGETVDTAEAETTPPDVPETEPDSPVEPEPRPEPAPVSGLEERKHSVQLNETLSGIAAAYGVSVTDLITWNEMDGDSKLQAGRVLTIYVDPSQEQPEDAYDSYVIQKGDSPLSIAQKYGISPEELMDINDIADVNTLRVGQALRVPKLDE